LVSGQLDLDSLDYLARDSFFTGVVEGKVGYERLIMMMNVKDGELVVEEKGVPSVEKFLLSRHLMYSQVYHHKTALATEQMLKLLIFECISTIKSGGKVSCSENLLKLINSTHKLDDNVYGSIIQYFTYIDDIDIMHLIKNNVNSDNPIIKILCNSLLKRKLFKVYLHHSSTISDSATILKKKLSKQFGMDDSVIERLFIGMNLNLKVYAKTDNPLFVLTKSGEVVEFSEISDILAPSKERNEFLIIAPKEV
jgi:HD superfamily phosphohydrolase